MTEQPLYDLPEIDPDDEMSWCDLTAAFLEWQGGPDVATAEALRAFHALPETPPGVAYDPAAGYGTAGAGGRELQMILYSRSDTAERRPGVLIFHGGGWRGGTPLSHRRQACALAERGFVAASVGYRLVDEARWPAAVEDAKCAIRWMRANHDRLGVDPDRIVVAGGSAGAYLAAMAALTPGRWEGSGGNASTSSEVQGVALFCPPTDLRAPGAIPAINLVIADFLGSDDEALIKEASPITHVSPSCPPVLTLVGEDDYATPAAMVREFHDALTACGVPNELVVYPGRRHTFAMLGEDWFGVLDRLTEFLHSLDG